MREPCAVKVACTVLRGEGFRQRVLPTRPSKWTAVSKSSSVDVRVARPESSALSSSPLCASGSSTEATK